MSQDLQKFSYSMSNESQNEVPVPFLRKDLKYEIDNSKGNYSRNVVEFNTVSSSNSGDWISFRDSFISIPLVFCVERNAGQKLNAADVDNLIQMKGSNLSIISQLQIKMNNTNVFQMSDITPVLIFNQHATLGENDKTVNAYHLGYQKHSSDWSWNAELGMVNNTLDKKFYQSVKAGGVLTDVDLKQNGANFSEIGHKVDADADELRAFYHYDCIIRLKDLPFFNSFPLVRGALLTISLTLNQGSFHVEVVGGKKTANCSSNLKGSFFPVVRGVTPQSEANAYTEDISVEVVSNKGVSHKKTECRLYMPSYTFLPEFETQYLGLGTKKVVYNEVLFNRIRGLKAGQSFQSLLSNSLSRVTKMIVLPVLNRESNGTIKLDPMESPFTTDGVATCSPCRLSNLQVLVANKGVYDNGGIEYGYEHFLNEQAGALSPIGNGAEDGMVTGQIGLSDFLENYNYYVIDLSRKHKHDDHIPVSYHIKGTVGSGKDIDLLTYLFYERDVTIDITTGQLL